MKTKNVYKLASKAFNKSDLKRIAKNMEESSESNSDSDSDSRIKQEIRRPKPLEKPARKKHKVDKYSQTEKPRVDSRTGNWLWESPYHRQYHKDEFNKGPYSSDIDSSED